MDERFALTGNAATWTDPTGTGNATLTEPSIYVAQGASPWALGLYTRALLKDADRRMPALPSGTLRLDQGETLTCVRNSRSAAGDGLFLDRNQPHRTTSCSMTTTISLRS